MKDNLKKHIEDKRPDFEVYKDDYGQLWEGIEGRLHRHRFNLGPWMWRAAAAILVIALVGYFALTDRPGDRKYADGVDLYELSDELAEAETYYAEMINEKLRKIQAKSGDVDKIVLDNISRLDSAYLELKNDLKENIDNQEVIDAMIENYRIKLEILEQILNELEEKSNDEFEPVTI